MPDWEHASPPVQTVADDALPAGEAEATLVARARYDPEAFAALYDRYVDQVYRYCYRRLSRREAAEDATSQVFTQALAGLPHYHGGSFRAWLFAIARNVTINLAERRQPAWPLEGAGQLQDPAPTPEEAAIAAEGRASLAAATAQLPEEQRSVIELRLAGLAGAEIAEAAGRTLGSVKMLQFRAVARLPALLGAQTAEHAEEGVQEEAEHGTA